MAPDVSTSPSTHKKSFGFHPLLAFVDHGPQGSGEPLAILLRTGNAGSNTGRPPRTTPPRRPALAARGSDGWRYQAFVTNTTTGQLAFLEARHRAHARIEDRIRHAKDSGLGRSPSQHFAINAAWLLLAGIAADWWPRPGCWSSPARRRLSPLVNPKRCVTDSCTCPPD